MMELNDFLQYKNDHLLVRYREDYPNNKLSAEQALEEMLKFFWLSHKHQQERADNPADESLQFACVMHREMEEIDDMWHAFLLFTRAYEDFCMKYFGKFMHHSPNIVGGEPTGDVYETELTRYLSYIYDNLGEQTVRVWFSSTLKEMEADNAG